jgi:hypothetical protein
MTADPRQAVVQSGVQFLEALATLLDGAAPTPAEANGIGVSPLTSFLANDAQGRPVLQLPVLSPEMLQRGAAAIRTIVQKFATSVTDDRV